MAQPQHFAPPLTLARYAHTLLFVCPGCGLPVSVSRISHEESLEIVDSQSFRLQCAYCREISTVVAAMAKVHWVTEWA